MALKKKVEQKDEGKRVVISAPNMDVGIFPIRGTTVLVMNKFSNKAKKQMIDSQKAGHTNKKGKAKKPKDFKEDYKNARHESTEGWFGIPASAFRKAMVSACRLVGFKMTIAKISVFILPDGFDKHDSIPLVKITKGNPEYRDDPVRISDNTTDIHARAMWKPGWEAKVTIRWDSDQFKLVDVINLLVRVGMQIGLQEGRPDSKKSCGMGWGLFEVLDNEQARKDKGRRKRA